jgi:hypothetical protein
VDLKRLGAMISRCSEPRERTMNWSEWSRERRMGGTAAGYRRTLVTSIGRNGDRPFAGFVPIRCLTAID